MGRKCSVPGCNSYVGVHWFPMDLESRRKWLRAIGMEENSQLPHQSGVCKQHFTRDSYANLMEVELGYVKCLRLKRNAVPTIALPRRNPGPPTLLPRQSGDFGQHAEREEQMSRMFDEVMGLGEFADSSRGSVASSKSGGPAESKGQDETLEQGESQPLEEDSNSSRQEKKTGDTASPSLTSSCSEKPSSFNMVSERGGGGSGGAAFDDALDGLPAFGPEEEDEEDWHYALPMGALEDVDVGKASKISQLGQENGASRGDPFAQKPRAEEEQQDNDGSTESANTSHSSQDNTPDLNIADGGLNQTEETVDSQQEETSGNTRGGDRNSTTSPRINIKDEPVDEGYDAALLPQNSTRQIKEELEQEEELRISSVFSVGGGNNFTSSSIPPAVQPTPTPTHILIPGRGAVLQASLASLPVRPPVTISHAVPTLTAFPPRPPPPAVPGSVRCSGCSKVLLKGQTAFQRKGSTQLFCSTVCLTGHLPPIAKGRSCFQCNREILQPRDMVTVPAENSTFMHFCGQFCLSVYRHKKKQGEKLITDKRPEKNNEKPHEKPVERQPEKPFCSVCKATKQIEHEVTYQGKLHRLCSDPCFLTWRKLRQLALNCCEGCGLYCSTKSGSCQTLTIEKSQLNFCSSTCIGTYKQTCRKSIECANCRKITVVSSTIMERDQKGKVQLYCSPVCVDQSRPSHHNLTGTPFPCGLCKVSAVPQYHLAMVDGTIRSFCSLHCVTTFRKSPPMPQPDLTNGTSPLRDPPSKDAPKPGPSTGANGATGATSVPPIPQDYSSSVPYPGHHPSHTSVPPLVPPHSAVSTPTLPGQAQARSPAEQPVKPVEDGPSDPITLTCYQCNKQFNNKPLLLTHQGRISMFCSKSCSEQYNAQKNVLCVCNCCKEEKVLYEVTSFGQQDVFFCSENCKQFYKQDRALRSCSYCCGLGQKMMHSHYGGKIEEFCKPNCMSQYTVLYYGMGRCNSCRKQGYMGEKLQCLGSVCNFCNMACLLQYCSQHFEKGKQTANSTAPPVPSDVVSLANGSASQPSGSADTALTGELPTSNIDGKNLDHASTQTDALRTPAPRRRQMKNKSVLCRPFSVDQEIMCELLSPSPESEALLDSSSQSEQPLDLPAQSLKLQEETEQSHLTPARLTGRHFLGKRESDSNCKVCSQRRKRKLGEEEASPKKQKMEDGDDEPEKVQETSISKERNDEEELESEFACGTMKRQTPYYCKTCTEEPSLCPVPCFELYHTELAYEATCEPPE